MGSWLVLLPANQQMSKVCITYGVYAVFAALCFSNSEFLLALLGIGRLSLNGNLGFFYHIFIGTPFGFLASMLMANDHQYLDTKLGRWIAYGRIAVLISLPVWFMAFSVIPKDLSKISIEALYNTFKFVFLVGMVTVVPTLPIMMLSFFNWRRLGATLTRH